MDHIQSIRAFARVVEAGTFVKAATSLDLTASKLTKLVQQLEGRLKVKLLNRTTRRVTVTHDGAIYYERIVRLLNDLDDIEASMGDVLKKPRGRLRLDVGTSIARLIVVPALPDFCERYPEIQLDLGVSDVPVDLISDNVDCVIRVGNLRDESLVARRIANLSLVTVASPAYLKRHGIPKHPSELEGAHTMVGFFSARTGQRFPDVYVKDGNAIEVIGRPKVSVNDSNSHIAALLAGLGISQAASHAVAPYLATGQLVEVLRDWPSPQMPLYVVYPPNRHLSAKVRVFVDWVVEVFAKYPNL